MIADAFPAYHLHQNMRSSRIDATPEQQFALSLGLPLQSHPFRIGGSTLHAGTALPIGASFPVPSIAQDPPFAGPSIGTGGITAITLSAFGHRLNSVGQLKAMTECRYTSIVPVSPTMDSFSVVPFR